ncbi:MAG: DNA polymerase III subunit epsilon [Rickettsiales bacterium]|jgi:DNA polymerase-3 subunit epsilon|nr:DNA polymerase III subunit epsilon [Rickettsiales bacterium]
MYNRKICFDTETTGLYVEQGDRIVEIGCVELINDVRTGKTFQYYLNPEKKLPQEVIELLGIDDDFLKDKPKFPEIAEEFLKFVDGALLIAHNASFDINFINYELGLAGLEPIQNGIIDTLVMAKRTFPGQKASLEALCKKFNIDDSKRIFHGALLDADLLVDVYIQLTGGVEKNFIEDKVVSVMDINEINEDNFRKILEIVKQRPSREIRNFDTNKEEVDLHREFIATKLRDSLWLKGEVVVQ